MLSFSSQSAGRAARHTPDFHSMAPVVKRGRGRPKGSKNKAKGASAPVPALKRGRGRPKGSKNRKTPDADLDAEPDVLVCPITPEAEPAPVLALDAPPRKSKKRQGGKPSAGARAWKNKKKRAKFKENGGVRPDGTPRPTRNDRRKKAKTRREAEAQAAVRAIVSPDERAGGDLAAHVAEGVGPPPQ